MVMEDSNKKGSSKSIIKNLVNLQLGINADQELFSYHTTLNSLMNLKPTKSLPNDPTVRNHQISEIQFNKKGNLLANSFWVKDRIQIWNWHKRKLNKIFSAGHNFTVMDFNWVPYDDDNLFVTSGRQGDIRLTDIETNDSRLLLEAYRGNEMPFSEMPKGYRVSVNENLPYTILAGNHTGKIVHIDVRDNNPTNLFVIKYDDIHYEILSLDINPVKCFEFCIGGTNSVRVYDHRNLSRPVHNFTIAQTHIFGQDSTSFEVHKDMDNVKYNFNGTEILATCHSETICLFDTVNAPKIFTIPRWTNSCSNFDAFYDAHFCGQRSEFVITITRIHKDFQRFHTMYIWDKETQELVHEVALTEDSRRFTVHPTLPVLAMNWDHEGIRLWQ